ncbi:hypothetical protein RDABS01_008341 [Bienertia sinuspersici]
MDEAKLKFPDREPIVKLCNLASSIVEVFEDSDFKECTQRAVELMEKSFMKKPSSCTFDAPNFDLGVDFSQHNGIADPVRKRKKVGSGDEEASTNASKEGPMKNASAAREQAPVRRSPQVKSNNFVNSGDNDGLAAPDVGHKGFVGVMIQEEKQKSLTKRELHHSEYYKSPFIMRSVNILKDVN